MQLDLFFTCEDPVVAEVADKLLSRSEAGMKKYGVTMARTDVTTLEWLRHAQEEALDFSVYLQRLIRDEEARLRC